MPTQPQIRLAELLGTLSLVTDLARGHRSEHAARSALLAARLAERMGLLEHERVESYYTALLRSVGCTATSHEYAAAFGDDVAVRRRGDLADASRLSDGLRVIVAAAPRTGGVVARARQLAIAFRDGRDVVSEGSRADCEVGASMARRFGLPEGVSRSLADVWERWDGLGSPGGKTAEAISIGARIAMASSAALLFYDEQGVADWPAALRAWSGRALDPGVVELLLEDPALLADAGEADDGLTSSAGAEPGRPRVVGERELDEVARGFAEVVDVKSPYLHGHAEAVAELAAAGAALMGLDEAAQVMVRRAGLLHDLGRAGVSTAIWEKPARLGRSEWERVRLHAYHSERILSPAPSLAPLARLAGLHHERLDGSGYHRGAEGATLGRDARVLAAADAYVGMRSERPHRPALGAAAAARALEAMPLDADGVGAVLAAAGETTARRRGRAYPAGLTEREVEILRLIASGRTEPQIADALVLSKSTVHTHVTHVYEKAGVSTRAAVAVFAMQHGLVPPY